MSDPTECPKCGDRPLLESLPRLYCALCDWREENETDTLRQRVAVLEEALRFYAADETWETTLPDPQSIFPGLTPAFIDEGERARYAFATTEGK